MTLNFDISLVETCVQPPAKPLLKHVCLWASHASSVQAGS